MTNIQTGDPVTLYPLTGGREGEPAENPRLWGMPGKIVGVAAWGAYVQPATGGLYRAGWEEMKPVGVNGHATPMPAPSALGFTGDVCDRCGSSRVQRAGKCAVCTECGEPVGGCS